MAISSLDVRGALRHIRAQNWGQDGPELLQIRDDMLKQIFAWWDTATIGTSFTLWRTGARLVGEDEQGNRFYESTGKKNTFADGRTRRWVVYHGVADASRVTPDWHGWMHHTFDEPPSVTPLPRQPWERDHLPNMTGTPLAYHPAGSLYNRGTGEGIWKDYQPWSPEDAEGQLASKDVERIEGSVSS